MKREIEAMAQAIGMDYTDFKQMLSDDVWPEVSHRSNDMQLLLSMTHKSFVGVGAFSPHPRLSDEVVSLSVINISRSIECLAFENQSDTSLRRSYELVFGFGVTRENRKRYQ